jgi:hypothetical protein
MAAVINPQRVVAVEDYGCSGSASGRSGKVIYLAKVELTS